MKKHGLKSMPFIFYWATMHMRILSIIFFASLMCGCQTKGDIGQKIVQQIAQYGGHTRTTNAIPELHGTWKVKSTDDKSFQAYLSGITFEDFKSFMLQVYGDPKSTPVTSGHDWGTPGHIYYRATDIGVAIEYFGESNGIEFDCHRGMTVHLL